MILNNNSLFVFNSEVGRDEQDVHLMLNDKLGTHMSNSVQDSYLIRRTALSLLRNCKTMIFKKKTKC